MIDSESLEVWLLAETKQRFDPGSEPSFVDGGKVIFSMDTIPFCREGGGVADPRLGTFRLEKVMVLHGLPECLLHFFNASGDIGRRCQGTGRPFESSRS